MHSVLYEAGLITYMRTDSVNLSDEARKGAQAEIERLLLVQNIVNQEIIKENLKVLKKRMRLFVQQIFLTFIQVDIERDQARLYDLIWKRAISSQMSEAQLERTNVKIGASTHNESLQQMEKLLLLMAF